MRKKEIINNSEEQRIVVPGETIVSGEEFLPSDGVWRDGDDIVAKRFGLVDISDKLVRVIALSGVYQPRKGNVIIGEVVDVTPNGWVIDFGGTQDAFLSLNEVPRYVSKGELRDYLDFGEIVCVKIIDISEKGIEVTVKARNLGKLKDGQLVKINSNKVPRVIGREGSMVNLIKKGTGCDIIVGQNGVVWVRSNKIENELKAKRLIEFVCENVTTEGLTERVEEFIKKMKEEERDGRKHK